MEKHKIAFDEQAVLQELKHYLPSQAPLKDFIHHNTLHAFQHDNFFVGINKASKIFGYQRALRLDVFKDFYMQGKIKPEVIEKICKEHYPEYEPDVWLNKLLYQSYDEIIEPRIGILRDKWKQNYKVNIDKTVHPFLFRFVGSYLDQGISISSIPIYNLPFLDVIRELEKNSFNRFFKSARTRELLLNTNCEIGDLLLRLVGDELLFEQYLFDQQFSHPGWSGMVAVLEENPTALLDARKISLKELIQFELLLEIDFLNKKFGDNWAPLYLSLDEYPEPLFDKVERNELSKVYEIWQQAFEWSYYNDVLSGISINQKRFEFNPHKSFEAVFCIDDRECSFRRYIEQIDPESVTFGSPGFFAVDIYFKPEHGNFYTKACPAPVAPKHIIKETQARNMQKKEVHFHQRSHSFFFGWMIAQTLGFWSAVKLFINIFKPTISPATSYSFRHMDQHAQLTIEHTDAIQDDSGLQVGYTIEEMAARVEGLLKSIGLVNSFSNLIYIVGHGASSVNNTHYAGYDCGACSGRPGSVNARVFSYMANHKKVRAILETRGILIPEFVQFVGAMHDTTRDEIEFYDESSLTGINKTHHEANKMVFYKALDLNAKERSRRFLYMNTKREASKVHEKVKLRSVSLYEPRPELNHATNALCIIGRRQLTKGLFLDRRAFLNSYDYNVDPEGKYLLNIVNAAAPVCGGINLEYFFSRIDNYKLGAGTKLPHNVMGLIGVANGADGDLRTGLPWQMVEFHDPLRLMMVIEHLPEVVLKTIKSNASTFEWFKNNWINLVVINPETNDFYVFENEGFKSITLELSELNVVNNIEKMIEHFSENMPILVLEENN